MTPELQNRLDHNLPPFDGFTIHNTRELRLSQLRNILSFLVPRLQMEQAPLRHYADWHEHDGFQVEPQSTNWPELSRIIQTDESLFDSRHQEFAVRQAYYPGHFGWLIRYNIDEEDEENAQTASCNFDISLARDSPQQKLAEELLLLAPDTLRKCQARPWFFANRG